MIRRVSRREIQTLLDRVDNMKTKSGRPISERLKPRNKVLISLLYLSGRRVSELLGRVYDYRESEQKLIEWYEREGKKVPEKLLLRFETEDREPDVYMGVTLADFKKAEDGSWLQMRCRVLKKGSWDDGLKEVIEWIEPIFLDDPFTAHVMKWINLLKAENERRRKPLDEGEVKLFRIGASRAWQIVSELDPKNEIIGKTHWFRHQRMSHLSEVMDPYELRSFAKWETIEPAVAYVHGASGRRAAKVRKADQKAGGYERRM